MTVAGEIREITANLTRLVAAHDRENIPQWEVQVRWPWTPANNRGGDKTWVYRSAFPEWDIDTKGPVNVQVAAAWVKKDGDGNEFDGTRDWMWRWNILKALDHAPRPAERPVQASTGAASPLGGQEEFRRSKEEMRWTEAVNNAVNLICADKFP